MAESLCSLRSPAFIILISLMTSCGGGSPYVGLWQCAEDLRSSLEIRRYEDYFIVKVKNREREFTREASFVDETFSVGANNVGQAMALELGGEGLRCTKPPNFCQCAGSYKKVSQLNSDAPSTPSAEETAVDDLTKLQNTLASQQLIPDQEPQIISLANGGEIRVFDHALNEEYGKRMFDWPKLIYYYLPRWQYEKLANGDIAELVHDGDDIAVRFQVALAKLDEFELIEVLHEEVNTKINPSRVSVISYDRIRISFPDLALESVQFDLTSQALKHRKAVDVSMPLSKVQQGGSATNNQEDLRMAQEIVDRINEGQIFPQLSLVLTPPADAKHISAIEGKIISSIDVPVTAN